VTARILHLAADRSERGIILIKYSDHGFFCFTFCT